MSKGMDQKKNQEEGREVLRREARREEGQEGRASFLQRN